MHVDEEKYMYLERCKYKAVMEWENGVKCTYICYNDKDDNFQIIQTITYRWTNNTGGITQNSRTSLEILIS